jgi:hypothetical protein
LSVPVPGDPYGIGVAALADLDQLGERTGGKARMHHDQVRGRGDDADRVEVLARIVAEVLDEAGRRPNRRAGHHQQRVAVGRGLRDRAGRDRAAGAAAVVDDDLLAEDFAHLVGDAARRYWRCRRARTEPPR